MHVVSRRQDETPLVTDPAAVAEFCAAIMRPGDVHEVRIPKTRRTGRAGFWGVASGYFDDPEIIAECLDGLSGVDAEGVYITLNPVEPALLARAANRLQDGRPMTTADADVLCRRHLLIDLDPIRPSGISATEAERQLALDRAEETRQLLSETFGWPQPVAIVSTGNGAGLIYRIRLDVTPETTALVVSVLRGIAELVGGAGIAVDTTVSNPARIAKIAGTVSAKGDNIPERPWRLATAIYPLGYTEPLPVPESALALVASFAPESSRSSGRLTSALSNGLSLAEQLPGLLDRAGIAYRVKERGTATVYALDRCLTSDDHTDGACFMAFPSGAVTYLCHHNRCQGKGWQDVKGLLGLGNGSGISMRVAGEVYRPETESGRAFPAMDDTPLDVSIASGFTPMPASAAYGWFRDYIEIVGPTSEAPDEFHLGASLALASVMVGRRFHAIYASDVLFPNLFVALVGRSGKSRKDTAIKRATNAPYLRASTTELEPEFLIVRDISSAQGMIKIMEQNPTVLLYLSEIVAMLKNARRESTATIRDFLIEAFDTPATLQNLTKNDPRVAKNPTLSIIAATQPGRFASEMSEEDIHSGFANRWLYITGDGKPAMARPPRLDRRRLWDHYLDLHNAFQSFDLGTELELSNEAGERFDAWYLAMANETGRDEAEDAMRQRHPTIAVKIATLYAASDRSRFIEDRHLAAAIDLIEWSWSEVRKMLPLWGSSKFRQIETGILNALDRFGPCTRRKLQQSVRVKGADARDFAATFEAMLRNGTIELDGERRVHLGRD